MISLEKILLLVLVAASAVYNIRAFDPNNLVQVGSTPSSQNNVGTVGKYNLIVSKTCWKIDVSRKTLKITN